MNIKISKANEPRIVAALANVNGRATAHTASCADIFRAAEDAEQKLASLGLTKAQRAGARCVFASGGTVPQSYKYKRVVNRVTLVRSTSGWSLAEIVLCEVWPSTRGGITISLTPAQDALAIVKLRDGYAVQKEVAS